MNNPLRSLARTMLGSMFVVGGVDALTSPGTKAPVADDVAQPIADQIPPLRDAETETLVQVNGAVQVAGGALLAAGKAPRLASTALAASLVPTTLAAHRFWEHEPGAERTNHQIHFFKNLSMLGGLLLAALDTEGRPSVAWRAQHATEHAGIHAAHTRREAKLAAALTRAEAKLRAEQAKRTLVPDITDAKRLVDAVRSSGDDEAA